MVDGHERLAANTHQDNHRRVSVHDRPYLRLRSVDLAVNETLAIELALIARHRMTFEIQLQDVALGDQVRSQPPRDPESDSG